MMGAYLLLAGAVCIGINAHAWTTKELWPKALVVAPAMLLLGSWLLFDARALARGSRQQHKAILCACVGAGSLLGAGIVHALTGRFF
ncbi:hypothetical protein AKJ09_02947 [Labilithrix luteola]|uniref:Uncharacterized protein n=1 Tax=Labilithrix luteola TaxID=1391654 RepID=A0A0K1PRY0_9BACT|nr:hypothetical protein [Labilithrix luteola]AKU96283.1 hypothetical protein AKJ09_02947 [Labilithrix luteola]